MLHYISMYFLGIFLFFIKNLFFFIIFISFPDELSNFRNRILINQKPEWVVRNCQWNCLKVYLTFFSWIMKKIRTCIRRLKKQGFVIWYISYSLLKLNCCLNCINLALLIYYFRFHSTSVIFYEMIKMGLTQNMSCYSFIISLVWHKQTSFDDCYHSLTNLEIINKVNKYSNYYHLWKSVAVTFYRCSCLCLQCYISWSSYTMKIKDSLLQWFAIKFLKRWKCNS